MTQYLVLEDARAVTPPDGLHNYRAGRLLDDAVHDIAALQRQGVAMIEYLPATMAAPLAAFKAQQGLERRDGDMVALLLGANAIGADSAIGTTLDTAAFETITGSNVQEGFDSLDTLILNVRTTGARFGFVATANMLDPTTVDVSLGVGAILDNTNPETPDYRPVAYAGDVGFVVPSGVSYLYVDSTATLRVTTTAPSAGARRLNIYVARCSLTDIVRISPLVVPTQQSGQRIRDITDFLGNGRVSGVTALANGANLSVNITPGVLFASGANVWDDPLSPNDVDIVGGAPVTFRHATRGGPIAVDRTLVDVANYNPTGSTVTAIPGGTNVSTVFRIFIFPASESIRILYGQRTYTSLANAVTGITTDSAVLPAGFDGAFLVGWLAAIRTATDLSNPAQATFVQSSKFGLPGGAVTGVLNDHGLLSGLGDDDHGQYALARSAGLLRVGQQSVSAVGPTTVTAARVLVTTGPDMVMLTCPATAGIAIGYEFQVLDVGRNAGTALQQITIAANAGQLINGAATIDINTDGGVLTFMFDGTNWLAY